MLVAGVVLKHGRNPRKLARYAGPPEFCDTVVLTDKTKVIDNAIVGSVAIISGAPGGEPAGGRRGAWARRGPDRRCALGHGAARGPGPPGAPRPESPGIRSRRHSVLAADEMGAARTRQTAQWKKTPASMLRTWPVTLSDLQNATT